MVSNMLDQDTFLTTLYVTIDDFCKEKLDVEEKTTGPKQTLSRSEVICLALFGQWARFRSERDFWRFANAKLGHLFPKLPHLSQFNRAQSRYIQEIIALSHHLVKVLDAKNCPFEAIDRCGVATRWCGRRGVGWLPEYTDKGYCSRLRFFEGIHLLTCVNPEGVITGFALGPGSAKDQPLASSFFLARHQQSSHRESIPGTQCVGEACRSGNYVTDVGFNGQALHKKWFACFGARVIHPDKKECRPWRRWLASLRQIIETVHNSLVNTFRLECERPHDFAGLFTRLSAKVALHNFCIFVNRSLGRPSLAFADLLGW
jgi:hypothetical protein